MFLWRRKALFSESSFLSKNTSYVSRQPSSVDSWPLAPVKAVLPARSISSTSSLLKMTKKQENAMKNDPRYQAMQRLRKEMEEKAKTGDAPNVSNRRVVLASTPKIVEPNLPPLRLPSPSTLDFYKYPFIKFYNWFRTRFVHPIRMVNHFRKLKQPPIGFKEMREAVLALYIMFGEDRAAGRVENLHAYCNPNLVGEVGAEVANRPKNAAIEYQWKCESPSFSLLSYRVIAVPPPINGTYVQVTYKIESRQSMKVVNKKTQEVIGGQEEPVTVVDYFGFEKNIDKDDSKWMIVEQLKR